jgi:hypothetical protein
MVHRRLMIVAVVRGSRKSDGRLNVKLPREPKEF